MKSVEVEASSNDSIVNKPVSKSSERKESIIRQKAFQQFEWEPFSVHTFGRTPFLEDIEQIFLLNRGYSLDDAESLKSPYIPSAEEAGLDLLSLQIAGDRFLQAAKHNEKVLIYGDSDLDGVASTFTLFQLLNNFGIKDVQTVAPARDDYGYGFNDHAAEAYGGKYDLIVAIDCGITAKDQVKRAKEKGTEVMIIDHHTIQDEEYPEDTTILHTTETSAAGIAYLLCEFYEKNFGIKMPEVIGFAGMAVYADNMSMTRVSRPIVKKAIEAIRAKTPEYISRLTYGNPKSLPLFSEDDISFNYSPLFNTPGRYGEANKVLRYLRSNNPAEQVRYAIEFNEMNNKRKGQSEEFLDETRQLLAEGKFHPKYLIYSIDDPKYDFIPTFIDPLTTRLTRDPKINRPVILGKVHQSKEFDEEVCIYQGRAPWGSMDFLPLIEILKKNGLIRGGGHPGAVGFTDFAKKREQVEGDAASYLEKAVNELPKAVKEIDLEIAFNINWINKINELQNQYRPFSFGLESLVILSRNVEVAQVRKQPNKNYEKSYHLYLTFIDEDDNSVEGVIFNAPPEQLQVKEGDFIDIVYTTGTNTFKGETKLQLKLEDFRKAKPDEVYDYVPPLPERKDFKPYSIPTSEYISIPEELGEQLKNVNLVGFDMDDTLKVHNKITELRYACFEAWAHSGDNYFRKAYSQVVQGTREWDELEERISEVSENVYGNSKEIFPLDVLPREKIHDNASRHTESFRTDEERGELYAGILGYETTEELWDYFLNSYNRGMKRRVDEFDLVTPGSISLLNYLTQELNIDVCLVSNSKSSDLLDMEELLRQEGFKGRFARKISARSMHKEKPNPYSLRNIFIGHPPGEKVTMAYIGNSIGDVAFATRFKDFENYPSPHVLPIKDITILPILINRGRNYDDLEITDPYIEFDKIQTAEKVFRGIPLRKK